MTSLQKDLTILVIEDNPGDFVLIQEYLMEEMDPSEILHAQTFDEAKQELARSDYFDVVLLDLTLPDASGESLVESVANLSEQTPVIVLTGYENKKFGLETLSIGVADYLLKDELTPFLLSKSISYSIERNRINESLRQSEKQYRELFDLSPLPKWVYDIETLEFIDVNQRAIDHYGYSRDEFLSMTIKDLWPGQDNPVLEQTLQESLNTDGFHESGIHHHKTKSGQLIEVDIRSTMITYNSERAKMVVANDVTERLETEKQLALSEKRFKSLVQDGADIIGILDDNHTYKYMSPTYKTVLGMDPDRYTGTSAKKFVHEDDQHQIIDHASKLDPKESVEVGPYRFKDTDGNWHWLESTITNMFDNPAVEGFVVNSRDVTESLEQERKLQDSLELYEYVTQATDDVVYDWDVVNDVLEWDDSFHEKFVYDIEKGQYTIDYWAQNVHPEDLADAQESLNSILSDPSREKWEQEYRFKMQDGSYATVFERGFIIRNPNGQAIRMIGSLQDISERKEYEEKLEELALVASKTTDIIIMTDPDNQITWVNEAFENLTGYNLEEAIGKTPGELLQGPETDPKAAHRLGKAIRNQQSAQEVILNYTKDGDTYWLDITIDPIFDDEGQCEGFIAIEKDVTEQVERQRKLQKSVDRYDIVSKATSDTIWDLNLETDTNRYNSNIYNMFGYQKQEVDNPAKWWRSKVHPDDREDVVSQMDTAVEADADRFQMKYRFECADGSYKHIYDRAFIVKDDDGKPIRMIGAMQDVTQQRKERKWLQLFESAIASTKESVAIIEAEPSDLPGRKILYVNEAFCQMTGYTPEEVKGETLNILNGPETSKESREKLSSA
ncbi:MAG TPA: PAS domain S-box protein, partial [Cryomorphaceae bacterium]|nr:PAS domain S-box protein [Cryomorphaceae bacterium]